MSTFAGQTALVTGASRGLGARIALCLAKEGFDLVLTARDEAKLERVVEAAAATGISARGIAADLTVPEDRSRLIEAAGPIDMLVNNAGLEVPIPVVEQTEAEISAQLALDLEAPIHLCRLVLPGMLDRGRGAIVNVSSMSGKSPTPLNAVYAGAKHGLNGFTASLRLELEGTGVVAGVVCPSFVAETGMWADFDLAAPALLSEVPVERVERAVLSVLRGAPEVLVTPGPVRLLLALAALFPGIDGPLLSWLGVRRKLAARADRTRSRRAGPR